MKMYNVFDKKVAIDRTHNFFVKHAFQRIFDFLEKRNEAANQPIINIDVSFNREVLTFIQKFAETFKKRGTTNFFFHIVCVGFEKDEYRSFLQDCVSGLSATQKITVLDYVRCEELSFDVLNGEVYLYIFDEDSPTFDGKLLIEPFNSHKEWNINFRLH